MAIAIHQSRSVYVLVLSKSGQSDDMGRFGACASGSAFPLRAGLLHPEEFGGSFLRVDDDNDAALSNGDSNYTPVLA